MEQNAFFQTQNGPLAAWSCEGYTFPAHLHPQLELLLVESGRMGVTVREQSQELGPGGLAVVFPNQIHSYQMAGAGSNTTTLIIDLAYTGGYMDSLLRHHPASPFLAAGQLHPNVPYAIHWLLEEYRQGGGQDTLSCGPLVQLVLARVMPLLTLQHNHSADHQNLTWQIVDYVNAHYQEPLTLESLSKGIGVNRYRLSHVFSEKIGQSFSSYLAHIRLSRARQLLQETERSVTEIGEEAGFESQRTFFRAFKRYHDMSPLEYRRHMRQEQEK